MKFCFYIALFLLTTHLAAQTLPIPLVHTADFGHLYHQESSVHTSMLPLNPFEFTQNQQTIAEVRDSLVSALHLSSRFATQNWWGRKLLNEPFVRIEGKETDSTTYKIIINPLLNLRVGRDDNWEDKTLYQNTRGIQLMGSIGKKFLFYSDFWENQALFPRYVHDFAIENRVFPGQGLFKNIQDSDAKDYGYANGHISYQPNRVFNFQFGHGKHFIGDGYRSLLLSDNAFNYPYFRITAQFWKIKYWVLYTKMLDINHTYPDGTFFNKYVTAHYLSFNINKRWNIGLYEAIVYGDETGLRGYDVNYLNPIIFYRPIEFALGSTGGNALLGLNLRYKVSNTMYAYGQVIMDEFKFSEVRARNGWWANKFGVQLGIRSFDTFVKGLTVQAEFNTVRPYTYSHRKDFQNYGHYNQPLAHPLGSNFMEGLVRVHYQKQRWFGEANFNFIQQGRDTLGSNWGTDIFITYDTREQEYDNETLQGVHTDIYFLDTKVGYIVNPSYNLRLEMGYTYRRFSPDVTTADLAPSTTNYFYVGLVTHLQNHYYDF